jgi:thioredoxin reductase (NADPH)
MTTKIYDVAVIGGGCAGVMAVLRVVLNNDECLFFPGSPKHKKKSRAFWVTRVENMPAHLPFKKGIEEPNKQSLDWLAESEFKDRLHWKKNCGVEKITKDADGFFTLTDNKNETYRAQFIILSTGVMDVQPEIGNSISPIFDYANVQLADYCLRCDGHHVLGKKTGVIGHALGAIWVAIMLHERYSPPSMTLFTNGEMPEFDDATKNLFDLYQIKVETSKIEKINGDATVKKLKSFTLTSKEVEVEIVFISLGMIVYNELAKMLSAKLDSRGFVETDLKGKSSIDGLYVAGDLRANTKKQIYTAWDGAVDSADEINMKLRVHKRQKLLE